MKVFTATHATQGDRRSDFCHANDGEIVTFAFECDSDKRNVDGRCGCRRSMLGVESRRATTTFVVSERDVTVDDLASKIEPIVSFGEVSFGEPFDEETRAIAREDAELIARIAASFPIGMVLEKRGDSIQPRVTRRPA